MTDRSEFKIQMSNQESGCLYLLWIPAAMAAAMLASWLVVR